MKRSIRLDQPFYYLITSYETHLHYKSNRYLPFLSKIERASIEKIKWSHREQMSKERSL